MAGPDALALAPERPAPAPRVPAPAVAALAAQGPGVATDTGLRLGLLESGDFVAGFGSLEYRLTAEQIHQREINLSALPQPVPGLRFRTARFDSRERKLRVTAGIAVPHLAEGDLEVEVDRRGHPSVHGQLHRSFDLPALGRSRLTVGMDENQVLTGTVEIQGADLAPRGFAGLRATGSGTITITGGALSGTGTVHLAYTDLGNGELTFGFNREGAFNASGQLTITPPFLEAITADFSADAEGNIAAHAELAIPTRKSPIPNLTLTAGTVTVNYENGAADLSFADFRAEFAGVGAITIATLSLDRQHRPHGSGTFALNIPMLTEASGSVAVSGGRISGSLTLGRNNFPEGLPIRSGTINARLAQDGSVSFSGGLVANFGPAGNATIAAAYGPEGFSISGEADLTIPGLNPVHLTASYANGDIAGEVQVPVDNALIPGLTGNVTVRYAQGLWSGETTLGFSADDGKLSGTVTVTVAQNDQGAIELGGSGALTAQLMPGIQGTLTATILPAGGVDVSGQIVVTEPYELFPEKRLDKELFSYSQNIPLWAILVAVIRVQAGVRAGIGPGVFRNITVTGSYTIGADAADPSFTVSGEMYIPAFVEGYVSFGAGLGLDVVLGSLTGGIEGVATAGIYGAISVVPELSYADGDWAIDGVATLAAGARLKLGLNAWAEIEALWITVWDHTWELAEFVTPIGPDLALSAHMHYVFGQPTPPEIDFNSSNVDTETLIAGAMPEDGPPASGAREALQNHAEWQGALREQRNPPVPQEETAGAPTARAPAAPARPPGRQRPSGGAGMTGPGATEDVGARPSEANEADRSRAVDRAAEPDPSAAGTVPASNVPGADRPRFPDGISLKMLDDPPVPAERTAEQQKQDLEAAKKVLELASDAASDSDALDNYFPRIKERFRLTSLGYIGDFHQGFQIEGKINPSFVVTELEPLTGRGIPAGLGRQTEIVHGQSNLGGSVVGMTMIAMPLGPDHPEGSGPSGQRKLMDVLPTGYRENADAESNFIQGHLLNDWLGGKGRDFNLFPITQHANTLHNTGIEEAVKDWVNKRRLWVRYQVTVTVGKCDLSLGKADNYVDSTIHAKASALNTKLEPVTELTREVTIASTFKHPAALKKDMAENADMLDTHGAQAKIDRPQDQAIDVLDTTRARPAAEAVVFPADMEAVIKAVGRQEVEEKLLSKEANGYGPTLNAVLWEAYKSVEQTGDRSLTDLNSDDDKKAIFRTLVTRWNDRLKKLFPG